MEDEATQPGNRTPITCKRPLDAYAYESFLTATQVVIDPRRLGLNNSGLDDDDLSDIFCILHPASMPAFAAVASIGQHSAQHMLNKQPTNGTADPTGGNNVLSTEELRAPSYDIALRLSALLKDPLMGFCFGRAPGRCDIVLGSTEAENPKRISGLHFRIFINEHGSIMLEDTSTNGTSVDGVLLMAKQKENNKPFRHLLTNGSVININNAVQEQDYLFHVRIPQREGVHEITYDQNLADFFERLTAIAEERKARARAAEAGEVGGPVSIPLNVSGTWD